MPTLKVKKSSSNAKIESPKHLGDAGYDLSGVDYIIDHENHKVKINTGIHIEMPELTEELRRLGFIYVCKGYSRSSVKDYGLILSNGTGLIDEPYRGEISGVFYFMDRTLTTSERLKIVQEFMKKAVLQLTFELVQTNLRIKYVDSLSETTRGSGGYGSTNNQ